MPVAQDHTADAVAAFDAAVGGDFKSALDRGEFRAKAGDVFSAAVRDKALARGAHRVCRRRPSRRHGRGALPAHGRHRRPGGTRLSAAAAIAWVDAEPGVVARGEPH